MSTLDGRTAIITGAGRGLGREHALLFARLGAKVVVNDTGSAGDGHGADVSAAREVVEEIRASGGEAIAHTGSVADWDAAADMVETAVRTFGQLDVLVNNAGILRDRTLANMSEAEWDAVMEVHLKGHFCPLRHAAAHWRAATKRGEQVTASVINTSSGSGLRGNPGQVNYASAKAGIAAMTVVAARELERYGVRVNAIAPIARTRLTLATPGLSDRLAEPADGDGFDQWDPANVSPLVAWLATESCTVSGQVLGARGGHIEWYEGWSLKDSFDKDTVWTVDELAQALDKIPAGPPPPALQW